MCDLAPGNAKKAHILRILTRSTVGMGANPRFDAVNSSTTLLLAYLTAGIYSVSL